VFSSVGAVSGKGSACERGSEEGHADRFRWGSSACAGVWVCGGGAKRRPPRLNARLTVHSLLPSQAFRRTEDGQRRRCAV